MKKEIILAVSSFLILIIGCSPNNQGKIIGVWKTIGTPYCEADHDFLADILERPAFHGAFLDFTEKGRIIAKYEVTVGMTEKYSNISNSKEVIYTYSIDGDELKIRNDRDTNSYRLTFKQDTLILKLIVDDTEKKRMREKSDYLGDSLVYNNLLECKLNKSYKFFNVK
jgi:hypothetical protein